MYEVVLFLVGKLDAIDQGGIKSRTLVHSKPVVLDHMPG